ncbi:hypothetical protein OAU50_06545, partial [Planctomycetota bacterium]|nr:hypothetical protein [Planctomycetota bacterium]
MKISKGFVIALLLLLAAGAAIGYGYWINEDEPKADEKDNAYKQFLESEYERLSDTDPKDLTPTEKELVENMGDDWESLEKAAAEIVIKRHNAVNKLAGATVGEYEWKHEPDGTNGWEHLQKAEEILSEDISFGVSDAFWDGSNPATEVERKELLDRWQRAEPHLVLADKADFIRSPQDEYGGYDSFRFYPVVRQTIICDFIELDSSKEKRFPRLEFVKSLFEHDMSPVTSMDALLNAIRMKVLAKAIRGAVKQGLLKEAQLADLEQLFFPVPTLVETWEGEFWTAARIKVGANVHTQIQRMYFGTFADVPTDLAAWVDLQTNQSTGDSRSNQASAIAWLKKNPGDLTSAEFANTFNKQEFANDKIIQRFSEFLENHVKADIAKASIHLYFTEDGQPSAKLPTIPMTTCKVEGDEIVFYWDA